jgi:hypothetical protein
MQSPPVANAVAAAAAVEVETLASGGQVASGWQREDAGPFYVVVFYKENSMSFLILFQSFHQFKFCMNKLSIFQEYIANLYLPRVYC